MRTQQPYIPALGLKWLLPAYDPLQRWVMREPVLKGRLVDEAQVRPGDDVLDVACGTGTLAVLLKQRQPRAQVVGLDVDPQVLQHARQKAAAAGVAVTFTEASATSLPFANRAFDRVVSSLAFHHLRRADKQWALVEVWRVLRPGGYLCLLDFGPPHVAYTQAISLVLRQFEEVADNIAGQLPPMMEGAGFLQVAEVACYTTALGTISLYRGFKGSVVTEQDAA
jgi:ubiquinone/menaquinone biosynthesis C-methylase UbiE